MNSTAWIGLGALAVTLGIAIVSGAVAYGRLIANVKNLTDVVTQLVKESRVDGESVIEMRTLVTMLRETVDGLQKTLRNGYSQRLGHCERRLDVLEAERRRELKAT